MFRNYLVGVPLFIEAPLDPVRGLYLMPLYHSCGQPKTGYLREGETGLLSERKTGLSSEFSPQRRTAQIAPETAQRAITYDIKAIPDLIKYQE